MSEASPRSPSLLEEASYLVGNVARIGHRLLEQAFAEHEVRLPHYAVLSTLADFGPMAQHELAERLDGNQSHLVGYVDHLQQRGLVYRGRDQRDRRRQLVALTPGGQALVAPLHELARNVDAQLLQALEPAEQATLTALLGKVLCDEDRRRAHDARPGVQR